jgi:hypothetical protein
MFLLCARCSRVLQSKMIQRIIRTESGGFRAAGLCAACADRHDSEQKRQDFWQMLFGIASVVLVFALASYLLLRYL